MARPSNRLERQRQIVKALVRVMAARGYERATVVEVAREAGLTPGLVHYHFATKEEILLAVVEDVRQRLRARVRRKASTDGRPRARLGSLLDAFVAAGDDAEPEAVATWVVLGAEAVKRPEVAKAFAVALEEAEQALEEAVTAVLHAEGRSLDAARTTALALLCAIQGAFQVAAAAPSLLPEGFFAPALRQMAAGLLEAREPPAGSEGRAP